MKNIAKIEKNVKFIFWNLKTIFYLYTFQNVIYLCYAKLNCQHPYSSLQCNIQ